MWKTSISVVDVVLHQRGRTLDWLSALVSCCHLVKVSVWHGPAILQHVLVCAEKIVKCVCRNVVTLGSTPTGDLAIMGHTYESYKRQGITIGAPGSWDCLSLKCLHRKWAATHIRVKCLTHQQAAHDSNNCNGGSECPDKASPQPQNDASSAPALETSESFNVESEFMSPPTVLNAMDRVYRLQSGAQMRRQALDRTSRGQSAPLTPQQICNDVNALPFTSDIDYRNALLGGSHDVMIGSSHDLSHDTTTKDNSSLICSYADQSNMMPFSHLSTTTTTADNFGSVQGLSNTFATADNFGSVQGLSNTFATADDLSNDSAFNLSNSMANSGLSDADIEAFLSSDAFVESFLMSNGASSTDGCVGQSEAEDFFYSIFGNLDDNSLVDVSCNSGGVSSTGTSFAQQSVWSNCLGNSGQVCENGTFQQREAWSVRPAASANVGSHEDYCTPGGWDHADQRGSPNEWQPVTVAPPSASRPNGRHHKTKRAPQLIDRRLPADPSLPELSLVLMGERCETSQLSGAINPFSEFSNTFEASARVSAFDNDSYLSNNISFMDVDLDLRPGASLQSRSLQAPKRSYKTHHQSKPGTRRRRNTGKPTAVEPILSRLRTRSNVSSYSVSGGRIRSETKRKAAAASAQLKRSVEEKMKKPRTDYSQASTSGRSATSRGTPAGNMEQTKRYNTRARQVSLQ